MAAQGRAGDGQEVVDRLVRGRERHDEADEALSVDARFTATVQELHLVGLHILCAGLDQELGVIPSQTRTLAGHAPGSGG